ncbi:hypothetical protein C8R44DRAFT_850956 [Mycena epipterygia]|nr:hypothetical protein C8R44DRAFT_850956 [Mycena epipterygia]
MDAQKGFGGWDTTEEGRSSKREKSKEPQSGKEEGDTTNEGNDVRRVADGMRGWRTRRRNSERGTGEGRGMVVCVRTRKEKWERETKNGGVKNKNEDARRGRRGGRKRSATRDAQPRNTKGWTQTQRKTHLLPWLPTPRRPPRTNHPLHTHAARGVAVVDSRGAVVLLCLLPHPPSALLLLRLLLRPSLRLFLPPVVHALHALPPIAQNRSTPPPRPLTRGPAHACHRGRVRLREALALRGTTSPALVWSLAEEEEEKGEKERMNAQSGAGRCGAVRRSRSRPARRSASRCADLDGRQGGAESSSRYVDVDLGASSLGADPDVGGDPGVDVAAAAEDPDPDPEEPEGGGFAFGDSDEGRRVAVLPVAVVGDAEADEDPKAGRGNRKSAAMGAECGQRTHTTIRRGPADLKLPLLEPDGAQAGPGLRGGGWPPLRRLPHRLHLRLLTRSQSPEREARTMSNKKAEPNKDAARPRPDGRRISSSSSSEAEAEESAGRGFPRPNFDFAFEFLVAFPEDIAGGNDLGSAGSAESLDLGERQREEASEEASDLDRLGVEVEVELEREGGGDWRDDLADADVVRLTSPPPFTKRTSGVEAALIYQSRGLEERRDAPVFLDEDEERKSEETRRMRPFSFAGFRLPVMDAADDAAAGFGVVRIDARVRPSGSGGPSSSSSSSGSLVDSVADDTDADANEGSAAGERRWRSIQISIQSRASYLCLL